MLQGDWLGNSTWKPAKAGAALARAPQPHFLPQFSLLATMLPGKQPFASRSSAASPLGCTHCMRLTPSVDRHRGPPPLLALSRAGGGGGAGGSRLMRASSSVISKGLDTEALRPSEPREAAVGKAAPLPALVAVCSSPASSSERRWALMLRGGWT